MSKLKTNTIQHTGGSADNITLDNSQNVTVENNLTVDGTSTLTGNVTASGNLTVSGTSTISGYHPTTSRSNRNLIINGAMQVAQRGTSTTTHNTFCVDRWKCQFGGTDEALTFSQTDVSAGTSPYNLPVGSGHPYAHGFRKCLQVLNGNQTSGAGASDYTQLRYIVEAQDIANSGWDYTSSSSYLTLSFWIKSSVAQDFAGNLKTSDGTEYTYAFKTGSLTQHTWTKVTKTIAGNANLTFNNDNGVGLILYFYPFEGTTWTGSVTEDAWYTTSGNDDGDDNTTTWWTTNDATLQITGVQLEVGSVATDFEHRSYGEELQRCLRYCQRHQGGNGSRVAIGVIGDSTTGYASFPTKVPMRATPSISVTEAGKIVKEGSAWYDLTSLTIGTSTNDVAVLTCGVSGGHNMSALDPFTMGDYTDFTLTAEL